MLGFLAWIQVIDLGPPVVPAITIAVRRSRNIFIRLVDYSYYISNVIAPYFLLIIKKKDNTTYILLTRPGRLDDHVTSADP